MAFDRKIEGKGKESRKLYDSGCGVGEFDMGICVARSR